MTNTVRQILDWGNIRTGNSLNNKVIPTNTTKRTRNTQRINEATVEQTMYYNVILRCNYCCCGKSIRIKYSGSEFVALGSQHATRLHHIDICVRSSSTVSHKRHDFKKGRCTGNKTCVLFPLQLCPKYLSL